MIEIRIGGLHRFAHYIARWESGGCTAVTGLLRRRERPGNRWLDSFARGSIQWTPQKLWIRFTNVGLITHEVYDVGGESNHCLILGMSEDEWVGILL
jgi:hypothetical protein